MYKVGDKIVVDNLKILLDKADALCTHMLSILLHCVTMLEADCYPVELGLTMPHDPNYAYTQCAGHEKPCTQGSIIIFECPRMEGNK